MIKTVDKAEGCEVRPWAQGELSVMRMDYNARWMVRDKFQRNVGSHKGDTILFATEEIAKEALALFKKQQDDPTFPRNLSSSGPTTITTGSNVVPYTPKTYTPEPDEPDDPAFPTLPGTAIGGVKEIKHATP